MGDVDRGAKAIKAVTGSQPRYVRPPDWIITSDARHDLERQGYRVLTISSENPMAATPASLSGLTVVKTRTEA